jgi:hypothetical protein
VTPLQDQTGPVLTGPAAERQRVWHRRDYRKHRKARLAYQRAYDSSHRAERRMSVFLRRHRARWRRFTPGSVVQG